jgi:hypothetical protein
MTNMQSTAIQTAVRNAIRAPRRERPRVSTDEEIRSLGTELKGYRTFVTQVQHLHIWTSPTGCKSFRFEYQNKAGAAKTHTLGKFGKWTLAMALDAYEIERKRLDNGECPRVAQLAIRANNLATVAELFADWFPRYKTQVVEDFATRTQALLDSDDFAVMRTRRLASIKRREILKYAQEMEVTRSQGYAREAVHLLGKLYEHAQAHHDFTGANYAKDVVKHLTPRDSQHFIALQLEQLPLYFADLDANVRRMKATTALALAILPYITVRPSVLRHGEWSWIRWDDPTGPTMHVPAFTEGTKQRRKKKRADGRGKHHVAYRIPLSTQVVSLLRQLQELTGSSPFLFPGYKSHKKPGPDKCISEGRWLAALRRMGWTADDETRGAITVHGFRALFATTARDRYCISNTESHALEFQQDHILAEGVMRNYTHDKNGSHRGLLLPQRVKLMQWWANEVDMVRARQGQPLLPSRTELAADYASRQLDAISPQVNS